MDFLCVFSSIFLVELVIDIRLVCLFAGTGAKREETKVGERRPPAESLLGLARL
jgi:hypothetical protein